MKREGFLKKELPVPIIHCPFATDSNDKYGRLTWDVVQNVSYSDGCAQFNGSSSYLLASDKITFDEMSTIVLYVKFNRKPTDGITATWMTPFYIKPCDYGGNGDRYYSYYQHYSNENSEITNNCMYGSDFSVSSNVLSIPWNSGQINHWYKMVIRRNVDSNTTDLWIDEYHKIVNGIIQNNPCEIYLGVMGGYSKRYMDGAIKDFMVFDIPLTDEQIAML